MVGACWCVCAQNPYRETTCPTVVKMSPGSIKCHSLLYQNVFQNCIISRHHVNADAACVFLLYYFRVSRIISLHFIQWQYVQGSLCLPDPHIACCVLVDRRLRQTLGLVQLRRNLLWCLASRVRHEAVHYQAT